MEKNNARGKDLGVQWPVGCTPPDSPRQRLTAHEALVCGIFIGALFAVVGCGIYAICFG